MSKSFQDATRPPFTQVLNTLPSPLTIALVGLGPILGYARHALEIISWKSSWEESWLALGCWWVLCLCSEAALQYALPVIACVAIILLRWKCRRAEPSIPTSEETLHQAMSDLSTLHLLLPHLPDVEFVGSEFTVLNAIRIIAVLYVPYLTLTHLVRLPILVAIAGTVFLTWRARWALLVRRALWRSAYIRWGTYHAWSRISGRPIPPNIPIFHATFDMKATSTKSKSSPSLASQPQPITSVRFLFTVYENQRWWMGLDWTAALLPGERPSWCTSNQQPVNPPAAFALPVSTTVYLPDPSRKHSRIRRTARWTWEEPEWRVCVRKEGCTATRVERPPPSIQEESSASASASRLLRAAGKMRPASLSEGSPERQHKDGEKECDEAETRSPERGDGASEEEPYTDADGWVYGDNKWEGGNAKGGIGKYTRYRRWTRVAVLTEIVEHVDSSGELGIRVDQSVEAFAHPLPVLGAGNTTADTQIMLLSPSSASSAGARATIAGLAEDDRSRLRQRLKAAVRGSSASIG